MPNARPLLDPVPAELCSTVNSRFRLRCTGTERPEVVERLGLSGLKSLTVEARVASVSGSAVRLEALVRARLIRTCVVTLEDFEEAIVLPLETTFDERAGHSAPVEEPADPESDLPEPLGAEGLELGELAIQHLSLALDPYPRHPDAPPPGQADWLEGSTESEFASQLARLKDPSDRA